LNNQTNNSLINKNNNPNQSMFESKPSFLNNNQNVSSGPVMLFGKEITTTSNKTAQNITKAEEITQNNDPNYSMSNNFLTNTLSFNPNNNNFIYNNNSSNSFSNNQLNSNNLNTPQLS
jgi:hypothetical protein